MKFKTRYFELDAIRWTMETPPLVVNSIIGNLPRHEEQINHEWHLVVPTILKGKDKKPLTVKAGDYLAKINNKFEHVEYQIFNERYEPL